MPRATWSGAISFGLINIPVKLYSAVSQRTVRFNQIDPSNNSRIRTQKLNAETGEPVESSELVRGFEVAKGSYVIVTDDELASVQPRATHTIDLEEFVQLDQVDPVYFEGAFHVAPGPGAAKPYTLLVEALEDSGRVAVARFVMRSRQYVALMRPVDGHLLLSMMVYADELKPASDIAEFDDIGAIELSEREREMAEQLIESLSGDFEPERYHDTYRAELMELINAKAGGATPAVRGPQAPDDDVVVDLMAALEKSVAEARETRKRHPSAGKGAASARKAAGRGSRKAAAKGSAGSSAKKATGKAAAKKSPAKRAPARKPAARKTATKKPAARKTAANKAAPARKAPAKKVRKSA